MLSLMNSAEAPVPVLASPLQFPLDLVDLCSLVRRIGEVADDDDE